MWKANLNTGILGGAILLSLGLALGETKTVDSTKVNANDSIREAKVEKVYEEREEADSLRNADFMEKIREKVEQENRDKMPSGHGQGGANSGS